MNIYLQLLLSFQKVHTEKKTQRRADADDRATHEEKSTPNFWILLEKIYLNVLKA